MSQQTIGRHLREAREAIPASLFQASRETKIRLDFLEHMEHDNFRFLSGGAYIKGLLRAYGRWLRLDERKLFEMLERAHGPRPDPSVSKVVRAPARIPPRKRARWAVAAVSAGAILLLLSLIGFMKPAQHVAAPPVPPKEVQPSAAAALAAPAPADAPVLQAAPPAPVPPPGQVQVTISAVGDTSWVEAFTNTAAGRQVLYRGLLPAGAAKTLEAKDLLNARIGNPGAVRISLNGRDLGPAGPPGHPANIVFSPQTMALAP